MDILTDLKVRVDALSLGVPCRLGSLPHTIDAAIALIATGGAAPDLGFGTAGLLYEYPHVMVMVRGNPDDYDGPGADILAIYQDFPKIQATALTSGKLYHIVTPLQYPFVHDRRDDKRRTVWMVNFEVKRDAS